jgi:phospholipid N-methyltransferase
MNGDQPVNAFLYLNKLIKDKQIASIMPTSASGVRKVCRSIDFAGDHLYVEYGPAAGIFSRYILDKMTPGSKMVLIERNGSFVSILRKTFQDARVQIVHDSAERAEEIVSRIAGTGAGADYVLSGIPFSFFKPQVRSEIVRQTHRILGDNGKFLAYQTFFQQNGHLYDHMRDSFAAVRDDYCLWNVPPLRIYEAVK